MNEFEFAKLYNYLCKAYRVEPDKTTMSIYYSKLNGIEEGVLKTVASNVVTTDNFFPSIARLLELCGKAQKPVLGLNASEEWDKVCRLIRRWGAYQSSAAYSEMSPEIVPVVKAIGWRDLCIASDYSLGGFERRFKSAVSQLQEDAKRELLVASNTQRVLNGSEKGSERPQIGSVINYTVGD